MRYTVFDDASDEDDVVRKYLYCQSCINLSWTRPEFQSTIQLFVIRELIKKLIQVTTC